MKLRLDKPWKPLDAENVAALPGQLGVYQIADAGGAVSRIGFAGAKTLFGLRSALEKELQLHPAGAQFRVEVNTQYQSRWRELLMLHKADHGQLPAENVDDAPSNLGRLS